MQIVSRFLRSFIIPIFLIAITPVCRAQSPENSDSPKKLNLFEPKLDEEDYASPKDYKNCIDLTQNQYLVILNGKKYLQPDIKNLRSFLRKNSKVFKDTTLNIISGEKTSYKTMVDVLDVLVDEKIERYKILADKKK